MPSFQLHPGFAAQGMRSNPWQPNQFVITSSQHYGVVGSGKVYVVETTPGFPAGSPVRPLACWGTPDGAFDACFSEVDRNTVVVGCGDGVRVYNMAQVANQDGAMPLIHNQEHQAEVSCVVWNSGKRDCFFSASWDRTIKMFSAANPAVSVVTMAEHFKEVYEVATTARSPSSILSCSGDGAWKLWDIRQAQRSVLTNPSAHDGALVLTIDFNKHDPNIFATGGVDRTVRLWDARRPNAPLASLPGHQQACRRVRFAPHSRTAMASAGYDMRVCTWDLNQPQQPMTGRYQQHREFVIGLEWSAAAPNTLASCSYDGTAFFWTAGQPPTPSPPAGPLPNAMPPPRPPRMRTQLLPGLHPPGAMGMGAAGAPVGMMRSGSPMRSPPRSPR